MNWINLSVLLLGGLAVFLYGMSVMTDGLKSAAGSRMKTLLQRMTRNRWTSLLAGTGITAVIQSSSVTTVLAVGFVSAGLLSFQSTLGLILGANVGTTITAQIIAFKITKASWLMIALGYLIQIAFSKKSVKDFGSILLGLGMVFLGMHGMSEATAPLRDYAPFIDMMKGLDNYLLGILAGTLFTAAVQSSSATTGVVIVLASQGLIKADAGIAIILGANVGTCVTAVLSALGKPKAALRVALAHVLFNVAGVVLWYAFIGQLANWVTAISPGAEARQIANAHTVFNLANTIIFIWLVNPVARLVLWLIPERKREQEKLFPELDKYYLEDIDLSLEMANGAISKLGAKTAAILEQGMQVALSGKADELSDLRKQDENIDRGHAEILIFLQHVQAKDISEKQIKVLERQIEAVNVMETAADVVTTNLVEAAEHRIEKAFEASEETREKLSALYETSVGAYQSALGLFSGAESKKSRELSKSSFKDQLHEVRQHLTSRLIENDENRISIYRFESELLEAIRRLHELARRLKRKAN